jgi:hypothetical protein
MPHHAECSAADRWLPTNDRGLRVCTVSFKSATAISHSVDVQAETLYEAAALGLDRLKKDG